jgi:hypothetical protein
MDDQKNQLQVHFDRFLIEGDESPDDFGDELVLGECWTWREPHNVEFWSIVLTPMTGHLSFVTKWKNCQTNLPVSLYETVTEVSEGPKGMLVVSCKTLHPDQEEEYVFSYVVPATVKIFSVSTTVKSLENSNFVALQNSLLTHIEENRWKSKDGGPLPPKTLLSRLNFILKGFDNDKVRNQIKAKNMAPMSISKEYTDAGGSHGSLVVETANTGRSKTKKKSTLRESRGTPQNVPTPAARGKKKATAEEKGKEAENDSMASALTTLPKDVRGSVEEIDVQESKRVYEEFWASCTDSYVFGQDKTFPIPIENLETPPAHLNIRGLEEKMVISCLNFFLEMPDPDKKNTLCAMPQNLLSKPLHFSEVKDGKFWMVNGQHSVEASHRMQKLPGTEKRAAKFKEWDCYIVWNLDAKIIRKISAYYNRVNHLSNYMPTWATNIISARSVWINCNRPPPPKEPTELGKIVTTKSKSARDLITSRKWAVSDVQLDSS